MSQQHRNRQNRRAKASAGSAPSAPTAAPQPVMAPFPFAMPMPPHTRQDSGFGGPGGWRGGTPPPSAHGTHSFSQQPGQSVSLPPGAFPGAYPFWPQPPGAFGPTPNNLPPRQAQRESTTHTPKRQRYQGDAPIGIGHPQHPSLANVTNIDHRSNPSATLRNRANLAILTDIPLSAGAGLISPAFGRPLNTPGPPPGTPPALLPYNQRPSYTLDSAGIQSLGHFPHSSLSLPLGSPLTRQGPSGPLGAGGPIPPPSPNARRAVTQPSQPSQLSQSHTRSASTQQRLGPPPKAILGGPGGRTFDKLRPSPGSSLKATPTPSATSRSSSPLAAGAQAQASASSHSDNDTGGDPPIAAAAALKEAIMHNSNPVNVALPPQKYSPPDTPAIMSPEKQEGAGEAKEEDTAPTAERVHRKEAFPWPPMQVGVTPRSIPLPLSPTSDDFSEVEKAFSPQVITPPARYKIVTWMGKEVRVAMPEEEGWSALRPSTSMEVDDDKPPSMDVDDDDKPTENVDTLMTENTHSSPTSSSHMDSNKHPNTPPTGEASMHTSPPGSSQWETAFESSSLSNSPPAFTAWEGPPTRTVTPSDDGPHQRISPIAEEYADGEQLEQASDKTETASAVSDVIANATLALAAASDDIPPPTAKPKLYSEEGGPVEKPEEHAALREVALGGEAPAAVEGEDTGQTVVLDRLMSGIASPMPSPFRKSFAGLAANPFLKRSLGGMLRQPRAGKGSDSVPPTPTRLTQSTTADEPANEGSSSPAADTAPREVASEDATARSVHEEIYRREAPSTTPPAQDSELGGIVSPKSFTLLPPPPPRQFPSPPLQFAPPPRHFASPTRQPLSPPVISPPRQFAVPTWQPLSPPIDLSPRQFVTPPRHDASPFRETVSPRHTPSPSFKAASHHNQASIDRAMASESLAEAVAAMSLAEAPGPVSRTPRPPAATTHWAFVARRPSAQSTQEETTVKASPPEATSKDGDLSWRDRSNSGSPPLHRDLQQLIRPDSGAVKASERTRQDEGDDHETVTSADEELKGDADTTTLVEQPPIGAAAPKASQRGLQATSGDMNEEMAASQSSSPRLPSSPFTSSTPITSPPTVHSSSRPKLSNSSPVRSFPSVTTEYQNPTQPGGLSPPKRLQATSATFTPRTTVSASPESRPFQPEPHPFVMGHTPKVSDASSTFTFGPPSAQPSPTKLQRSIASATGRLRPTFETPADADPIPQDSNAIGNGALGLFTFGKLRPNALEFKPIGNAPKPRISPSSGVGPPALDLSAAAPSSRAFASFGAQTTLGKPFEFNSAASKPALVIRKPNPIPILKPKDIESPTTNSVRSPHRQSASPRNDDAVATAQPPASETGADSATNEARDQPRSGKHTAKRSSQNSHLPRVFAERSQPSTPMDSLPDDVQIHQSKPIRLISAVGHMVRSSSDGVLSTTRHPGPTEAFAPIHPLPSDLDVEADSTRPNASKTVMMNRTVSEPTILSAKAEPFVLGRRISQAVADASALRLEAFLHHTPQSSNMNAEVVDENKFRHWVFPRPETHSRSPSTEEHDLSLSHPNKRRHSNSEEDLGADDESISVDELGVDNASEAGHGSTVEEGIKWPNWPHGTEVLSPESNAFTTTETSAEFPMRRTPPRRLSVINTTTPLHEASPGTGGRATPIVLPRDMLVAMLSTMKGVGEQVMQTRSDHQRLLEESTKRAEAAANQSAVASNTLEMIKSYFTQAQSSKPSENVASILEAHTELLQDHTALLQEIQQKIEDETRTSTADSAELVDRTLVSETVTNSQEMLTAILSGQHAMMTKFGEYTEAHEAVHDLRSATDALLEAQAEARQVKIDQQHGHQLVHLHDELRDESTKTAQAEREVAALKAKLDAAEKAAKSKELEDVWRALIRADVAAATSALAKVTRSEEHARAELVEMRDQLARQSTAHQTAIEALKQERDAAAKLADARHKELVEHQASTEKFRNKLLERLDELGHSFERELEKKRGNVELEREALARERIAALEKEVHDLRAELSQSANDRSELRIQLTQAVADVRFEQEKAIRMADTEANAKRTIELQLKAEKARAAYLETKMQRSEADVGEVASNLDAWRSAAIEQRLRAEQATTHVSALQQENFHWRQFALGADRHRLEQWLATRPFEGIDEAKASAAPRVASPSPTKTTTPARPGSPARSVLSPASRPASPVKGNSTPAVSSKLRMVVPVINEPEGVE